MEQWSPPSDFQFSEEVGPRILYSIATQDSPVSQQLPIAFQHFSFETVDTASPGLGTNDDPARSLSLTDSPHHESVQGANRPHFPSAPQGVLTPDSVPSFEVTGAGPSPLQYHDSLLATQRPYIPYPRSMSLPEGNVPTSQAPPSASFVPPLKQLRFVNTEGQPHTKRRRINAACLTCRKRKTRCSGEHPYCKTCTDNGHSCAGYADKSAHARRPGSGADDEDGYGEEDEEQGGPSSAKRHVKSDTTEIRRTTTMPSTLVQQNETISTPLMRDDLTSPSSSLATGSTSNLRHRVPFFRYFGPTAIVPGFKQMVVQVKDRDHRRSGLSISSESPASGHPADGALVDRESSPQEITFYDASDIAPTPALVIHLCEVFFNHLGCNYPFIQRERFMNDLREKRVDAILVDAVCAIASRFSSDPSLNRSSDVTTPTDEKGKVKRAFKGQPFAQRAAAALIDTFGHPTLAVAQACLLLAYEEFGTDRDSGLWMFLGTSIRMAQDLGIQKLEGMQLEGRLGPTPKTVKASVQEGNAEEKKRELQQEKLTKALLERSEDAEIGDRRASETERIDSFWSIFFLDRAVSSGVGRPVTLRDKDIEISFPYRPDEKMVSGYPHPFPVMTRIVHLYGRIADVINNIQGGSEVNADGLKSLTAMEKDLTGIYQKMSSRLHFNATNFQHYVKAGQGTNFILLHFWFHTSIILLHQPTLMYSLDSRVQQLFEDSRDLSMSSAKTIADIIAFAELIDVSSFIGNPFTSQPMYVAACAFLAEARAHASQPTSRQTSPPEHGDHEKQAVQKATDQKLNKDSKAAAKHSLLASAANQNYQRCYKALKLLDSYWAGCRYILTALDQKSKGLLDPILYTREDIDGDMPSIEPSFTQPGWRKSAHAAATAERRTSIPWSPRMDWSQAIGWSLTGTTNSPAPNLSFLYPNPTTDSNKNTQAQVHARQRPLRPQHNRETSLMSINVPSDPDTSRSMPPPRVGDSGELPYDPVSTADADLLLGLHSPYSVAPNTILPQQSQQMATSPKYDFNANTRPPNLQYHPSAYYTPSPGSLNAPGFNDMLIESQDIDMSQQFTGQAFDHGFPGGDMIWLEYLPPDVLNYFNHNSDIVHVDRGTDRSSIVLPSGPGPPPS